jgi:hypothetical protein
VVGAAVGEDVVAVGAVVGAAVGEDHSWDGDLSIIIEYPSAYATALKVIKRGSGSHVVLCRRFDAPYTRPQGRCNVPHRLFMGLVAAGAQR